MEIALSNSFITLSEEEEILLNGGSVKDAVQAGVGVVLISTAPAAGVAVAISPAGPVVGVGVSVAMVGLGCSAIGNVYHRIHN